MALSSALNPALHALEITFRNEISRAASKLMERRQYAYDSIPSWLDATPTMLLEHEAGKVAAAKEQLGKDVRSRTEGHLIAKLDFGFWVALCRDPYSDWRADGPRLWPRALDLAFRTRPDDVRTRSAIHHRFDAIRQFRNRVAHHEPIWDRDYLAWHERILDSTSWMSPRLADAVRAMSPAASTFQAGSSAYRPHAETLLGKGSGLHALLETKLRFLPPNSRSLVESLVNTLAPGREADRYQLAIDWAASLRG